MTETILKIKCDYGIIDQLYNTIMKFLLHNQIEFVYFSKFLSHLFDPFFFICLEIQQSIKVGMLTMDITYFRRIRCFAVSPATSFLLCFQLWCFKIKKFRVIRLLICFGFGTLAGVIKRNGSWICCGT